MAPEPHPLVRNRRSISSAAENAHKPDKKYKIEYKLVTAEKKPLKFGEGPPPPGYRFVATGSAEFTTYCKERCQKAGFRVYISNQERKKRAKIDSSRVGFHITRDGYYFPNKVVDYACEWLDYSIDKYGVTSPHNTQLVRALRRHKGRDEKAQIEAAMRELFPKMPEETAAVVVGHAFGKAQNRVGNISTISLAGRVQLAVNAHIRHVHTEYDQLLASGIPWPDARSAIQPACIKKLKEWRGEDGATEFEETFQEWIDLRDEDDELSDDEYAPPLTLPAPPQHTKPGRLPAPPQHTKPGRLPALLESSQEGVAQYKRRRSPSIEFVRAAHRKENAPVRFEMSRGAEHVYPSVEHSPSHHHARRLSSLQFSDPTQTLQFHAVHPADNDQFRYAYHGQSARTAPSPPEYMPNQRPGYLVGYLREPPLRGHLAAPTRADYDVVDLTSSPRSMRHAPPARVRSPPRFTIVNSPVEPSGYGVEARGPASHERARPLFQGSEPRPQVEMDNRPVLRQEAPPRGVNQNRSSFSQVALPSRASRLAPAFGVPGFGGSMSVNSHNYRDSPLPPPPVAYHAAHPPTESWVQFNGTRSQPVK